MTQLIRRGGIPTIVAAAVILAAAPVSAQTLEVTETEVRREGRIGARDFVGLGLDLGYPFSGIMLKYFPNERNSLQIEVGYNALPWDLNFEDRADEGIGFRAAYLGYPAILGEGSNVLVPFYLGIGASYALDVAEQLGIFAPEDFTPGSDVLTAFVPIGVQLRLKRTPLAFFLQIEPGVFVTRPPDEEYAFGFSDRVGFGGAYYF